jgi:hypothetical protein
MLIADRGERCGICHVENVTLHAHETWEYIEPHGGLDPERIQLTLSEWTERLKRMPSRPPRPDVEHPITLIPIMQVLEDIQFLCQPCHICKHNYDRRYLEHWCRVNGASAEVFHEHYRGIRAPSWLNGRRPLVVAADYSCYDEMPDYKTVAEWRDAMREAADALAEEEGVWIEEDPRYQGAMISD